LTALGLVSVTPDADATNCVPSTSGRNGSARWARRKENIKDRQNRQCLFCGRGEAKYRKLEIHHVKKQEHGGTDARRNVLAACPACHRLIHNVERNMPFAARLNLALQVLRPESILVTWVCRMLFRAFLNSAEASGFHPAALLLRPLRSTAEG
jgi:hypothetical protein